MKLILVGCLHGAVPKKLVSAVAREKPDAILYLGDLCDVDKLRDIEFGNWDTAEIIEAVFDKRKYLGLVKKAAQSMKLPLKYLGSLNIPVFLVYGNNDFLNASLKKMGIAGKGLESMISKNITLLKGEVVQFQGIFIAGFPGYRGITSKESSFGGVEHEQRLMSLQKKITHPNKTIFMTHDVPYGIFDIVKWKGSPAFGRHVGEKNFKKCLRKKMLLFACAHMHEHQGLDFLGATPVVAAGYGREGKFAILDIEGDKDKISKIKFYK